MRKTISLLLCTLMTLSLCCFGVSAAAGTAVKTAEEFAAMDPAGTYYLDADLTITASYALEFTGTLDGNGHTVTVSVPLFGVLNGTVKNLTLQGKIEAADHAGALALKGSGITAINVTNNADVSSTKESAYLGGLIGGISTGSATKDNFQQNVFTDCVNNGTIHCGSKSPRLGGLVGNCAKHQFATFTNCVNNGKIDVSQDAGAAALANNYVGGIVGGIFHGKFVNCVNNADLNSGATGSVGGIIGHIVPSSQESDHSVSVTNCTNNGNLSDCGRGAGGIVGYCGVKLEKGAFAVYTLDKCVNNGNVTQIAASGHAGGFIGYVYGQTYNEGGSYQYAVVTNCVNYGTITSKKAAADSTTPWASQFIGYTNTTSTTVKDCVGLGKVVTDDDTKAVFVGLSSSDSTQYAVSGVKLVENDGTKQFSYAADSTDGANDHNRIALADRPAGMIDVVSKADAEAAVKVLGKIGYADPNAPVVPDTPVTPDTPATPDKPVDPVVPVQTADSAVYFVAAALVAVLGAALVSRKITER